MFGTDKGFYFIMRLNLIIHDIRISSSDYLFTNISHVGNTVVTRLGLTSILMQSTILIFFMCPSVQRGFYLKVVGNEKVGGSGRWQMIDIGLGLW